MNDVQTRFKALAKRAKKVHRSLVKNGCDYLLKHPSTRNALIQKYQSLDKIEEILLGLEEQRSEIDWSIDSFGRSQAIEAQLKVREELFESLIEEK